MDIETTTRPTAIGRLRATFTSTRSPLERELAQFRSPSELAELSAVLDRCSDADAEPLRDLVDLTAAA